MITPRVFGQPVGSAGNTTSYIGFNNEEFARPNDVVKADITQQGDTMIFRDTDGKANLEVSLVKGAAGNILQISNPERDKPAAAFDASEFKVQASYDNVGVADSLEGRTLISRDQGVSEVRVDASTGLFLVTGKKQDGSSLDTLWLQDPAFNEMGG